MRRAAYLKKHRERWHENKKHRKVKTVKDLSDREKSPMLEQREKESDREPDYSTPESEADPQPHVKVEIY